jgi:hypothetical protein
MGCCPALGDRCAGPATPARRPAGARGALRHMLAQRRPPTRLVRASQLQAPAHHITTQALPISNANSSSSNIARL